MNLDALFEQWVCTETDLLFWEWVESRNVSGRAAGILPMVTRGSRLMSIVSGVGSVVGSSLVAVSGVGVPAGAAVVGSALGAAAGGLVKRGGRLKDAGR